MQLQEKITLQEQVNELQGQLDELKIKGQKFCYKTRTENLETLETRTENLKRPNSCSRAIQ